jgi:hypothetical protein
MRADADESYEKLKRALRAEIGGRLEPALQQPPAPAIILVFVLQPIRRAYNVNSPGRRISIAKRTARRRLGPPPEGREEQRKT